MKADCHLSRGPLKGWAGDAFRRLCVQTKDISIEKDTAFSSFSFGL